MSNRERLPDRRAAFAIEYRFQNHDLIAHIGRYGDHEHGRVGEIFITCKKTGNDMDTIVRALSTVASIAMQYGADVDTIRKALPRNPRDEPMEPLGTILDLVAKEVAA